MSINFLNSAFDAPITGPKKAVLIALCDRASYVGFCYPSIEDIAYRAGCSKRTVIRAIEELEALGYLSVSRGQGKLNKYILSAEKLSTTRDSESPKYNIHNGDTQSKSSDTQSKNQCHSGTQTINNHQEPYGGFKKSQNSPQINGNAYLQFQPSSNQPVNKPLAKNELCSIKNILAGIRH